MSSLEDLQQQLEKKLNRLKLEQVNTFLNLLYLYFTVYLITGRIISRYKWINEPEELC